MANDCYNTLEAPSDVIQDIANKYITKESGMKNFNFNLITPIPEENENWYKERIEKWGTSRYGYDVSCGDNYIMFDSAWCPPIPILSKLAELYKGHEISLSYDEPGNGFVGLATAEWQDGKVILVDECRDMTREDYIEMYGYDEETLNEMFGDEDENN